MRCSLFCLVCLIAAIGCNRQGTQAPTAASNHSNASRQPSNVTTVLRVGKIESPSLIESQNWKMALEEVGFVKIGTRRGMFDRPYYVIESTGADPSDHLGLWVTATSTATNKDHPKFTEGKSDADSLEVYVFGYNEKEQAFEADSLEGVKGVIPFEVPEGKVRKHVIVLHLTAGKGKGWQGQTRKVVLEKLYDFQALEIDIKLPKEGS